VRAFAIALKDLRYTFRDAFSVVMMLAAPLLITGLLYFAFGGLAGGGEDGESATIASIDVAVANMDVPTGTGESAVAAGRRLVEYLEREDFAELFHLVRYDSADAAHQAVADGQAAVAVLVPEELSRSVTTPGVSVTVEIRYDPARSIGPSVVENVVRQFVDGFSGSKIAAQVALHQLDDSDGGSAPALATQAAQQYSHRRQSATGSGSAVAVRAPRQESDESARPFSLVGLTMAGMLVFFAFFMGANGASSIVREQEEQTFARLRTTSAGMATILGGKLLGIVLVLVVQLAVLLGVSAVLFGIRWGRPGSLLLATIGTVISAGGLGVLIMSFARNTRQVGSIMGSVLTVLGMLGGLFTTTIPGGLGALATVQRFIPQAWALAGFRLALSGAGPARLLVPFLVLVGAGVGMLAGGIAVFRHRET
jgi:ABC-2 type transport system permease protein